MKAHPKLVGPKGGKVYTQSQSLWFSYNDQWPLTAIGHPVGLYVDARTTTSGRTTTTPTTTR